VLAFSSLYDADKNLHKHRELVLEEVTPVETLSAIDVVNLHAGVVRL